MRHVLGQKSKHIIDPKIPTKNFWAWYFLTMTIWAGAVINLKELSLSHQIDFDIAIG